MQTVKKISKLKCQKSEPKCCYSMIVIFLLMILSRTMNAADCISGCQLPIYTSFDSILSALNKITEFIVKVAFPIAGMAIVWTGIKFLLARGDERKITEAKESLMWAVIGVFVALGAYVIVNTIKTVIENL